MIILDNNATHLTHAGDLEIDLRPAFDVQLRYTAWHSGLRLERRTGRKWQAETIDPGLALIPNENGPEHGTDVQEFIQEIPEAIRQRIAPFYYHQSTLLCWIARDHYAMDLLISNSVLLWLLVDYALSSHWSEKEIHQALKLKQKDLLKILIREADPPSPRLLRKITLNHGDSNELRAIIWTLKSREIEIRLRHCRTIPIQIVNFVYRFPDLRHFELMNYYINLDFSDTPFFTEQAMLMEASALRTTIEDIKRVGLHLERISDSNMNLDMRIAQCKNPQQLISLHDNLTQIFNRIAHHTPSPSINHFPDPPVPGVNGIVEPILSNEELIAEGKHLQHCVASYADKAKNRQSYFYRILKPERATLEIKYNRTQPTVLQCCGRKNKKPSAETLEYINEWLAQHFKSIITPDQD